MDNYLHNKKLSDARDLIKKEEELVSLEMTKQRLVEMIEKKIMTTCVGSIERFEMALGHLWGRNKIRINEDEGELRAVWSELRKSILDLANLQIRNVRKEIEFYSVELDLNSLDLGKVKKCL